MSTTTAAATRTAASSSGRLTAPSASAPRSRLKRLVLGPESDPRWARPGLLGLLIATAVLYLSNITNSGYANEFYAASVKSATQSWSALLWASLDSNLSITVDKPPAAIWIMGLSGRLFGFSSASMLVPEALMGVATVGLLYGIVRRLAGHGPGLIAGALAALTPVAALMFRFNNPDALLTLCMTWAAYCVVRALQSDKGRRGLWWMVGAGWLVGLAFLTKMLQGLLVLPALALVYLICSDRPMRTRIGHLFAALGSFIVSAGWLIALCAVVPASARPYIGGSTNNSLWELALGYNGLGRILGGSGNGGAGGSSNSGFGGTAGVLRMFNSAFGTEVSWFLPAAVLLLVAGLVYTARKPRTDGVRAGLILMGTWLVVTDLTFSFMSGTIHPYYVVAMVPALAGTVALGAKAVWDHVGTGARGTIARAIIALAIALTAGWSFVLLNTYAASWLPAVRWIALIGGIGGALVYFLAGTLGESNLLKKAAVAALIVGSLTAVAPSAAWTVATASQGHSGSIPVSGPSGYSTSGMGGGMGGAPSGTPGQAPSGTGSASTTATGSTTTDSASTTTGSTSTTTDASTGTATTTASSDQTTRSGGTAPGGMGGSTSTALVSLLNNAGTKWSAAVVGDQSAAGLILNTDTSVYCIGGWSGSDNNVSLDQFKQLVASGQIHYFVVGGQGGGGMGGSTGSASQITSWVTSTFSSTTVGGQTVYDLTTAK